MTLTFRYEKWLRHDKPWINSGDQLQMVENGFILDFDQLQILQTTNIANYKPWLQVVGGVFLYFTSLLMTTSGWQWQQIDKQIGFRKTFVNKHWIKDEVFTAISLLSLRFY